MPSRIEDNTLDVIIIGAGFGGCYLLRNLRKQGFRVRVFEEGLGLGGVWWHNRYPGARVDTNTPFYEFSDPELWAEWDWTEEFPSQEEILKYFEFVDRKWDLSKDITFGSKVTEAAFNARTNEWIIRTDKAEVASARYLVPAMGFASKLFTPRLPGLETFQGFQCHTAKWPEHPIDFKGKKIGVMGTGATGVQVIQELGPDAGELVVFQRTPNCTLPMRQKNYALQRPNKQGYQEVFRQAKLSKAGIVFPPVTKKASEDTPEQQQAMFEQLWLQGGFAPTHGNYSDFMTNIETNRIFYNFWRDKVRQRIRKDNPELIENLAPWNPPYPFATKRPSLEQNYYEVLSQDNVKLIALAKNPIQEIVPTGARMLDGSVIELDALILATGFDAVTGSFSRVKFEGSKGTSLNDQWASGIRTFLGMTTSGFPNMFFLYGPQSPTAWAAGPVTSEIQSDWIIKTMLHMRNHNLTRIDAKPEAEQNWSRYANELCNKTLLPRNKTTWYMGGNIPGKKREALNFVGGLPAYAGAMDDCLKNNWADFTIE